MHARLARSLLVLLLAAAPAAASAQSPATDPAPAEAAFRRAHGAEWSLTADAATGRARRLTGGAIPLGDGAPADAVLAFLRAHAELLDLRPNELRLAGDDAAALTSRLRVLRFEVAPHGVPVEGGRVTAVLSHGRLVHLDLVGTAPVFADPRPTVVAADAARTAIGTAGLGTAPTLAGDPSLVFLPREGGHVLAWKVTLRQPPRRLVALVDARSGTLIELRDETIDACAPPSGVERRVLGGVRPESALDPERVELLPQATVSGVVAARDGFFVPGPPPDSAVLEGPVVHVDCVSCASPTSPRATVDAAGDLDFGSGGADSVGNGSSTPADRAAYFQVAAIHRLASRWLALPFLTRPVTVHTNLQQSCNAMWDGQAMWFLRGSALCANTAEIRDIVVHEWGHALDENDGQPTSGAALDAATGEAAADVLAMLRSRDACIGESFQASPFDWPSGACSGVRDLDERAAGHRRGTLNAGNVDPLCPSNPFYRGVYGREGHCEGELLGQAWWHLVQNLLTGASYSDGSPLGLPALPTEEAWQLAESLYFESRPVLAALAPASAQSIGISAYDALLLADDEGDGIANGTPHAAAIHEALAHHGIAELPAAPPTGTACTPPADPIVTATLAEDPSSGFAAIRLDWTDTGGVRHHVLRADDPDDASLPIGLPFGPGAGSFLDRAVLPGRTYRYHVVAESAAACLSPGAAPVVASAGPILRVATLQVDDVLGGDGDSLLEPGETADAWVMLTNTGSVGATNVRVSLTSPDPGLAVTDPGPIDFGNIGPGASVVGSAPFTLRAFSGVSRLVPLTATGESDQGCLRGDWLLELGIVDLELAGHAIDDSAGNADQAWDPGEWIILSVDLRNAGPVFADPVDATLSLRAPVAGVSVPRPSASWPRLGPRATETSEVPHFALDATGAVAPRTIVPLRLDVNLAGASHRSFDIDLQIGGVAAGTQQWTDNRTYMATTPIVVQLTDDDGDGSITACDVADVVLTRWTGTSVGLAALHGDTGGLIWLASDPILFSATGAVPAAGDIDLDGIPEIVVGNKNGIVSALRAADGSILWSTTRPVEAGQQWRPQSSISPVIADLEGDGTVEVVVGYTVLNGVDGSVKWELAVGNKGHVLVVDLDLDGKMEIIGGSDWDPLNTDARTWRADGRQYGVRFDGYTWGGGVANLDADPYPEVAWLTPFSKLRAWNHDGTPVFPEFTFAPTQTGGTASPCFADVDGDGIAESIVPIADQLWVIDDDGSVLWTQPFAGDYFDACSTFDFDRDGRPEIVVRDETALRVHDGITGATLWEEPLATFYTHWARPTVADMDGDGAAEIAVLAGGNFALGGPVRVYGAAAWPPARPVWSHHDYATTMIEDDGGVPVRPAPWWISPNCFAGQVNSCPCGGPELVASASLTCGTTTACYDVTITGGRTPFTVSWDFRDGSAPRTGVSVCHDHGAPGPATAVATVTDADGCTADAAVTVTIPEPLTLYIQHPPSCAGDNSCFTAVVAGGVPPYDITWTLGTTPPQSGVTACAALGPGVHDCVVYVQDAMGCRAEDRIVLDLGPPDDVGPALRVTDHGSPLAPLITARLSWPTDAGLPRPAGESYHLLRGTSPTALAQVPGTAGYLPMDYVDSTPRAPGGYGLHYYVVLAEDACGLSAD